MKKIVFKKLTIKETQTILGGTSEFQATCEPIPSRECDDPDTVCLFPIEPDCYNYKPDIECQVTQDTDCR